MLFKIVSAVHAKKHSWKLLLGARWWWWWGASGERPGAVVPLAVEPNPASLDCERFELGQVA